MAGERTEGNDAITDGCLFCLLAVINGIFAGSETYTTPISQNRYLPFMNLSPAILFLMGSPEQGGYINLIFLGLIFVVFYFFIIRPQSKKQKELQSKIDDMQKGDKVVTSGGMIGKVVSIDEDSFLAEIDSNVKARFLKSAVADVNPEKNS